MACRCLNCSSVSQPKSNIGYKKNIKMCLKKCLVKASSSCSYKVCASKESWNCHETHWMHFKVSIAFIWWIPLLLFWQAVEGHCVWLCVQSVSNVLFQYFWMCHNIIGDSVHSDAFHSWVHRQNMYESHWESGMFSSCLSHLYHQSHNESLGSYSSWKQSVWLFGRLVVNTPFCSFPPLCSIRTGVDQALCQVGSAGQPEALQISQCLALAITHPPIS